MFYVHDDILNLIAGERVGFFPTDETLPFQIEGEGNQIGPGSIDLRLGLSFRKFKSSLKEFDINTSDDTELFHLKLTDELVLEPGEIILASTLEKVFLSGDIGAILTGRSSLSRLGLQINISQSFIQPGYFNTIPLQLVNLHKDKRIKIPSQLSVCQIILFKASSSTTIPYSINPLSKYSLVTPETEPSKLGIEFGINSKSDFKTDTQITPLGNSLIRKFNDKLRIEASLSKKASKNYKNDEAEIGKFIIQFIGQPNIVDSTSRTSFREDTIFKEIQSTLANDELQEINILDVCCGFASWIDHLEISIGDGIQKVNFVGVDINSDCIKKIRGNQTSKRFKSFKCEIREANSLESLLAKGKFDIIFFTNSLHEIEPSLYPGILESMNRQINQKFGKMIITDMEELPEKEIESVAITWTKEEVQKILKAGGFEFTSTRHEKEVSVFQIIAKYCKKIMPMEMLVEIKELLIQKRLSNIELLEHIESIAKETTVYRMQWLKQIGLIARISTSIKKINEILPKNEKAK